MRELNLKEYQRGGPFPLSAAERNALRSQQLSLTIEPACSASTTFAGSVNYSCRFIKPLFLTALLGHWPVR